MFICCYISKYTHFWSKLCRFCQFCSRIFYVYVCIIHLHVCIKTNNFKTVLIEKRCSAWHKNTNVLLFFQKFVIFGFYAGKCHNLIGLGRFQEALNFFRHKIQKSRIFKKSSTLIVINALWSSKIFLKLISSSVCTVQRHGAETIDGNMVDEMQSL